MEACALGMRTTPQPHILRNRAESQPSATRLRKKDLGEGLPIEAFFGTMVNEVDNCIHIALCDGMENKALREKELQYVICIFIRTAPRVRGD